MPDVTNFKSKITGIIYTVKDKVARDNIQSVNSTKYTKPATGIPYSDLASEVQEKLDNNGGGGPATQVQSDWNESDSNKPSYIKNKPAIPVDLGDLSNNAGYTKNEGTVTGVKMNNGNSIPPNAQGVVNLGTVLTQHLDISGKVDKETGKGLSSNDYTTAERTKLNNLPTASELESQLANAGSVKSVSINGSTKTPDTYGNINLGYIQGDGSVQSVEIGQDYDLTKNTTYGTVPTGHGVCGLMVNMCNSAVINNDLALTRVSTQSGKQTNHSSHGTKVLIGSNGKAYVSSSVNLHGTYDSPNSPSLECWLSVCNLGNNLSDRITVEDTYVVFRVNDPVVVSSAANDNSISGTMYIISGSGAGQLFWVDANTLRFTATVCLGTTQNDLVTINPNDRFDIPSNSGLNSNWVMSDALISERRTDSYLIYRDFDIVNKTFGDIHTCLFRYTQNNTTLVKLFSQSTILELCINESILPQGSTFSTLNSNNVEVPYFWFNNSSTYGKDGNNYYLGIGVDTFIKNGLILKTLDFETYDFYLYPNYLDNDASINIKYELSCFVAKGSSTAKCLWVASRLADSKMFLACMKMDGSAIYSSIFIDESGSRNEIFSDVNGTNIYIMHSVNGRTESVVERCSNIHTMSSGHCGRIASGFYMSYPCIAMKTKTVNGLSVLDYYIVTYTDNKTTYIGKFRGFPYNNRNTIPTMAKILEIFSPEESTD